VPVWHKVSALKTGFGVRGGRALPTAFYGKALTTMMLTALGLMSGTSLDGVDVAMIETDGKQVKSFGPSGYRAYTDRERTLLRAALTEAVHLPQRDARPGVLREAEEAVTLAHAEAVAAFVANNRITFEDIDIVGFHGQTVLHRPERRLTVQIGDAAALAKAIHIPVMHDFRAADVAAGGQGAPFVPVYHRALAQSLDREGPIVVVNIGGVSNITYIDGNDTLIACDTGPGNALLDDFMFRTMRQAFDCEGRLAAQGIADDGWVARALELPFFSLPPPKSLDRNDFAALKLGQMQPADGAATLTAFTAAAIARIAPLLPKPPKSWIVAGGGARNLTMIRMLRERLEPATVEAAEALGWASDAIEAQAFGFLAARGLKGLPLSYPATTGVPIPMTGGVIARP
jgi:anhydro-N-acetylmuramic acid kinase